MTKMRLLQSILCIAVLLLLVFNSYAQKHLNDVYSFIEHEGSIAIEAEHFTNSVGAWEQVEGRNTVSDVQAGLGTSGGTSLSILATGHASSKGIPQKLELSKEPGSINFGIPSSEAVILASHANEQAKAAVFYYPKGSMINGKEVPAIRMGTFHLKPSFSAAASTYYKQLIQFCHKDGKILFIGGGADPHGADKYKINLLKDAGYKVTIQPDEHCTTEDAKGHDIVYVSETVSSGAVGKKFMNVDVPVVSSEPYIFDDMDMIVTQPRWKAKSGQSGNAMLIRQGEANDYLRYLFFTHEPGTFYVNVLGQNAGSSAADEVLVSVNSNKPDDAKKVILPSTIGWSSEPKQVTFQLEDAGWHELFVLKGNESATEELKYPGFRVDKLILSREASTPQGDGIAESINKSKVVPGKMIRNTEFLPEQIFQAQDGYCIIEAEDVDHFDGWVLKKDADGYTGKGYLEWQGTPHTTSIDGVGGNHDSLNIRQGPRSDWLILRIQVEIPGMYAVNARNIHKKEDGDNDAWVTLLDFETDKKAGQVISRMGDSHSDGKGLTWLDWGVRQFYLNQGINEIYVGGRSIGFGLDRFAIYLADDEQIEKKALDINQRASDLYQYVLHAERDFKTEVKGFAPYYKESHNLAIDASKYQDKFAAAVHEFTGNKGNYDIKIRTITEEDGESTYRLKVNGELIGSFQNPKEINVGSRAHYTWDNVSLNPGDKIQIESNAHSNGEIPEGDAFGFARGRWIELKVRANQ